MQGSMRDCTGVISLGDEGNALYPVMSSFTCTDGLPLTRARFN